MTPAEDNMDDARLLSVIVTSYNNSAFLRACLDSILKQTYRPIEIVVADDASTDDSVDIIREYGSSYPDIVRFISSDTNKGVACNRHNAIVEARGRWFVTLDGDDRYHEVQKLDQEMKVIITHIKQNNKDVAAFSNILIVDADDLPKAMMSDVADIREGFILPEVLARSCMIPRDFVFSREAYFAVGGYDFGLPIYEDWDLKIRLAEKMPFFFSVCRYYLPPSRARFILRSNQ